MPEPARTVIGHLTDVQGGVLSCSLIEDDQGRVPTVTIGDEDIAVGQLGSYVAIRQGDVHIVAIVTRMTAVLLDLRDALLLPRTTGSEGGSLLRRERVAVVAASTSVADCGAASKRGPAPMPTSLHLLRGSWRGKAREKQNEPKPRVGRPRTPA